jgi:UDP-N-acetylmuramate dehydrogenase
MVDIEKIIQKNILLKDHSTFRIGGPADLFAEAHNEKELEQLLAFAKEKELKYMVMGGASNILFSDDGFRGLVIKMAGSDIKADGNKIIAFAGTPLRDVVAESEARGLSGLEWASEIPGSVGGAVRGNAGAYGGQMADAVESVDAMEEGRHREYTRRDCKFSYRSSIFKEEKGRTVVSVVLGLTNGDKNEISKKIKDIAFERQRKIPDISETPNIGSIFKNFSKREDVDKILVRNPMLYDLCRKQWGNKISVAYLIDDIGLKGKKFGGAMISPKHGNFIVNFKNAKAEDVVILINVVKERMENRYKIRPEEEIEYVGF